MICVFFLFCSVITHDAVPTQSGYVYDFPNTQAIVLGAHADLDGYYFHQLEPGDMIRYNDGEKWTDYLTIKVFPAQSMQPLEAPPALLIDNEWRSVYWIFDKLFGNPDQLILWTCTMDGDPAWGRLFVVAEAYTP